MTNTIRIVETGEIFNSINECARAINGSRKNIALCLNDKYPRHTHMGYHFEMIDRCDLTTESVPIRIVETGEEFSSARECERNIDGNHAAILKAAKTGGLYKGLHFEIVDDTSSTRSDLKPFLYPHQEDALKRMFNGCILNGGTGSGKSRTGIYYFFSKNGGYIGPGEYKPMRPKPPDLYIITIAKKRDDLDWQKELAPFRLSTNINENQFYGNKIIVDSWQNITKYSDVENAQFIFDEDKLTGNGVWVKTFLKIAKTNEWIILSASPGDKYEDFIPVFIANGFYKNKTEFSREHLVYARYSKFPKVERYLNTTRLDRLRDKILIDMDFERHTIQHHEDIYVKYDTQLYRDTIRNRWDYVKNEPIAQAAGLCYALRRIVNSDESRQVALLELLESHPKAIIFYNFDYELEILLNLGYSEGTKVAQWNGHSHQPIPEGDKWVYLCQYTSACEGFNCITTDTTIFFSQNYSYKTMLQANGRIDRLNTPYTDLYYYHLKSRSGIDLAISKALQHKKKFNERKFAKWD